MAASPIQKLASALAKAEGKKSQSRIGDIREILKLLVQFNAASMTSLGYCGEPLTMLQAKSVELYKKLKRRATKAAK